VEVLLEPFLTLLFPRVSSVPVKLESWPAGRTFQPAFTTPRAFMNPSFGLASSQTLQEGLLTDESCSSFCKGARNFRTYP
jgi:hypothetical protein